MTRLIRLPEVERLCGLRRSAIYTRIRAGHFPKQVSIGKNSTAWIEAEVQDWINNQIRASRDEGEVAR